MAGIRNLILLFNTTMESEARLGEFNRSFILSDVAKWGPDRIEQTIRHIFSNITWKVSIFDDFKYLIQAPTLYWAQSMTRNGVLRLNDIKFPVVLWEPRFNEGKKLVSLWVKIWGFPHLLWQWQEVDTMLNPLGVVLLEMDPGTRKRCDNRFLHVRIGICDRDLLPPKHWMLYIDASAYVSSFDVYFDIETENPTGNGGRGPAPDKGKGNPSKKPPPGTKPPTTVAPGPILPIHKPPLGGFIGSETMPMQEDGGP